MPSYVRSRILSAPEFALAELDNIKRSEPAFATNVLDDLRHAIHFESFIFSGIDLAGLEAGKGILLATNVSKALFSDYARGRFFEIDPLVDMLSANTPSASWFDVPEAVKSGPKVSALVSLLDQHNLAPRTVFSFWNPHGKLYGTAVFTRRTPFSPHERRVLLWLSHKLHDDMSQPVLRAFNLQVGLTDSELRCLQLASLGLTSETIGKEVNSTTEAVHAFIKSATKKLGARSRPQACADAVRLGLFP